MPDARRTLPWCRSMPPSASPCVATTLVTCAIGHQARSPGLCRSLHPENVVLTGGRLPVSAPPHVSSHRVIVGAWPASGRPWEARSSARCSQWPCRYVRCHSARSLRTRRRRRRPRRPVRWCPSACGFVAVVRGSGWLAVPFEARSSARCWQWPCRYVRCLSACSLRAEHWKRGRLLLPSFFPLLPPSAFTAVRCSPPQPWRLFRCCYHLRSAEQG